MRFAIAYDNVVQMVPHELPRISLNVCMYVLALDTRSLTEIYCHMCVQLISLSHDVFMRNSPITFPRHRYDLHK